VVQFTPEVLQAGGGSGLGLWITNMIIGIRFIDTYAYKNVCTNIYVYNMLILTCIYNMNIMNNKSSHFNILGMHDGKITVHSKGEGRGCSFTVEIDMERKARSLFPNSGLRKQV
jgi:hypothetical protein